MEPPARFVREGAGLSRYRCRGDSGLLCSVVVTLRRFDAVVPSRTFGRRAGRPTRSSATPVRSLDKTYAAPDARALGAYWNCDSWRAAATIWLVANLRDHRVCSANASPTRSASEDVFACAMFEVTAMTMPLSRPIISDITMPPASSPLTLPGFVASAKRTTERGSARLLLGRTAESTSRPEVAPSNVLRGVARPTRELRLQRGW